MLKRIAVVFACCVIAWMIDMPQPVHAQSAIYPAPSASPFPQGCIYNSTLPTLTSGTSQNQIECDSNGRPLGNGTASVPSPIPIQASQYARTYSGGSITTGGIAQNWATTGQITHGCQIENTSGANEYIRLDGNAASTTSIVLYPTDGYYECPATAGPSTSASIYGATTGQTYYAETW